MPDANPGQSFQTIRRKHMKMTSVRSSFFAVLCIAVLIAGADAADRNANSSASKADSGKQANYETVKRVVSSQFWLPEFRDLFSKDFTLEMPYAPPGMPQFFNSADVPVHWDWLARTVRSWRTENIRIFGPAKGEDVFWVMRDCAGDVHWGGTDGRFESMFISKIVFENGRIKSMKEYCDPLAFLKASGREVPVFKQPLDPAAVAKDKAARAAKAAQPKVEQKRDDSRDAIAERIKYNLKVLTAPDAYTSGLSTMDTEDTDAELWFAPYEMNVNSTPIRQDGHVDWIERSSVRLTNYPNPIVYETDNPDIYLIETGTYGEMAWAGNNARGGYRNRYVFYIEFEKGLVKNHSECLNPINKFNSINVSIPSFPYFY
jgi:ketosteroid isomerase-like protein